MKRYTYQKSKQYYAQHGDGVGGAAVEELRGMRAWKIKPSPRGVHFIADREHLYRICYSSRIASRILAPIATFNCHSDRYLYRMAHQIEWSDFMSVNETFAIFATVAASSIKHSQYAALKVKDALCDYFREKTGKRPNVERIAPDLHIGLHILKNHATLSIDVTGGSLHRRGYRKKSVEAPMQETLAAAIISLSGWNGDRPLHDPMCGSGTLLAEALMHGTSIPAGYFRKHFGFERLPDYDAALWKDTRHRMNKGITNLPDGLLSGSDIDGDAVGAARTNLALLPGGKKVDVYRTDLRDHRGLRNSVIVINPPYGIRIGTKKGMTGLYHSIGEYLRRCKGSEAYIYMGDPDLMRHIGLKHTWKKPLKNGGLEGVLAKYEL